MPPTSTSTAPTTPTTPTAQRRKRAPRQFYISIRSDGKTKGEEAKTQQDADNSSGSSAAATKPELKKKYSHRVKAAFSTLEDDIAQFAKQKLGHWALVVEAYPNDPDSKRFFEICTKHKDGWADDSDQSDRYEDDEADGLPVAGGFSPGTLGMRVGRGQKKSSRGLTFTEPNYNMLGGVCWKLLSTLKSTTRFSNSEIRNEAERIWKRQQDYRFLDNNCQRFCILLAIHIRAKQSTTLRLLNGNILKKQAGKTEKTIGAVGKFLRPGKNYS